MLTMFIAITHDYDTDLNKKIPQQPYDVTFQIIGKYDKLPQVTRVLYSFES